MSHPVVFYQLKETRYKTTERIGKVAVTVEELPALCKKEGIHIWSTSLEENIWGDKWYKVVVSKR